MARINSRAKGKRGENEAAKALSEATGWQYARVYGQARQGDDAPDIDAPGSPYFVEVKLGKSHRIERALEQAVAGSEAELARVEPIKCLRMAMKPRVPLVLSREDRGELLITMRLSDWAAM